MDVLTTDSKSFAESKLRNEGRWIAMKHFNNYKIILNKIELFQQPLVQTFGERTGYFMECLKVLASGDLVAGYKNTIRIWDVRTATCKQTWTAYHDYEEILLLDQLPSGELVTGSDNAIGSQIKIWDLRRGNCINTWPADTCCLKVLPTGDLIIGNPVGIIKIYDVKSGKCIKSLESYDRRRVRVASLKLLPTGKLNVALTRHRRGDQKADGHTASVDDWYYGCARVTCLEVLPSGELVSGFEVSTIKIWDVKTGNCLKTLIGHTKWVCGLQVLPSGDLASASLDDTIRIWDVQTGECIKTLEHAGLVDDCLHLLPSGELVSGSSDRTIKIWNIPNWKDIPKVFGSFHYMVQDCRKATETVAPSQLE